MREASINKYDLGTIGKTQHDHGHSSGQFFSHFAYILNFLTHWNGPGHTGTDKDIYGQTETETDRQGQTVTDRERPGPTGTDRDKKG